MYKCKYILFFNIKVNVFFHGIWNFLLEKVVLNNESSLCIGASYCATKIFVNLQFIREVIYHIPFFQENVVLHSKSNYPLYGNLLPNSTGFLSSFGQWGKG